MSLVELPAARVTVAASQAATAPVQVAVHSGLIESAAPYNHPAANPSWLPILREGLQHAVFLLEATQAGRTVGSLPLALVQSVLFGRFLVSLPYINSSGVVAESDDVARQLIDRAVELADKHDVRYLELRHEREIEHPALTQKNDSKVLMRLPLPKTPELLLASFKSKLRSQIKSGEKHNFDAAFGGQELLGPFYDVFSRNMRDLGTPVYSQRLFASILSRFGDGAELCVLRLESKPVAAALLLHGSETSEVPSASSLRAFNSSNANMVMYWQLLKRAAGRGQKTFDFGRSTIDSNTYRFKKQWGAEPHPSVWQYYVRRGSIGQLRPDNAKFSLAIRAWQRLPVWLTRLIGPAIVRCIP